jgi:hypothetical protein
MHHTLRNCFYLFLFIIITSCNHQEANVSNLEKYFTDNTALHTQLFDSLVAFCKTHHKDILLKKNNLKETAFAFHIPFETNNYSPVFFDSAFVRHDPDPRKTGSITIPLNLVKKFSESIYNGIAADSVHAYFAEDWDSAKHGTPSNSQSGILISTDTSIVAKCSKRIAPNVCVKTGGKL